MLKKSILEAEQHPNKLIRHVDDQYTTYFYKNKFLRICNTQKYTEEKALEEFGKTACEICTVEMPFFRCCPTCAKSICYYCFAKIPNQICPYCRQDM